MNRSVRAVQSITGRKLRFESKRSPLRNKVARNLRSLRATSDGRSRLKSRITKAASLRGRSQ